MKSMLVIYGAVGVSAAVLLGYLIYRQKNSPYAGAGLFGFLGNTADAASAGTLSKTGEDIGGAVFDIFHPTDVNDNLYYRVIFPDNQAHAIHATDIDKSGYFYFNGQRYQMVLIADVKYANLAP